jgi:hypothetical protein
MYENEEETVAGVEKMNSREIQVIGFNTTVLGGSDQKLV